MAPSWRARPSGKCLTDSPARGHLPPLHTNVSVSFHTRQSSHADVLDIPRRCHSLSMPRSKVAFPGNPFPNSLSVPGQRAKPLLSSSYFSHVTLKFRLYFCLGRSGLCTGDLPLQGRALQLLQLLILSVLPSARLTRATQMLALLVVSDGSSLSGNGRLASGITTYVAKRP